MNTEVCFVVAEGTDARCHVVQLVAVERDGDGNARAQYPVDEDAYVAAFISRLGLNVDGSYRPGYPLERWRRATLDDLPKSRRFRDAWVYSDGPIELDMGKAAVMRLEELRRERKQVLEELDVESLRALEERDEARLALVVARKNSLREMPVTLAPALSAAKTAAELDAVVLP